MSAATNTPGAVPDGAMWASVDYFWRDVGSGPEFWHHTEKKWCQTKTLRPLQEYELCGVLKRIAPATAPADFCRPSDCKAHAQVWESLSEGVLNRIALQTIAAQADFRRPSDGPAQPAQPAPVITPAPAFMVAPLRDSTGLDVVAPFGQRRMWGAM